MVAVDATHIKAHRLAAGAKGAFIQAVGTSRGGRTTKLHRLTDEQGRPRVLQLSAGNVNDMTTAASLIEAAGPFTRLIVDRGYDTNAIRTLAANRGAHAVIPSTTARRAPIPYDRNRPQPRRTALMQAQGPAAHRHPLRQSRSQLRRLPQSHRRSQMSPGNVNTA